MRKVVLLAVAASVFIAASSSYAYIRITWGQTAPTTEFGETPGVYTGSNGVDDGNLVQLIWSLDNTMDPIALDGSPTGNDQVIGETVFSSVDSSQGLVTGLIGDEYSYTDLIGVPDNATLVSGYVYVRAFDQPSGSTGVGTHYLQGGMVGGPLFDSPSNVNDYNVADYTGGEATPLDMTIVPEPGTFALFGLGLATLAMRRRFRK